MGAGKSTIGRIIARSLGLSFLDTDSEIEERTGADIPWIFDVEGEEGFRDREEHMVEELTQRDRVVLATGGGVVLRPANRQALTARGFVVYLRTTLDEQLRRTAGDRKRPLLTCEGLARFRNESFRCNHPARPTTPLPCPGSILHNQAWRDSESLWLFGVPGLLQLWLQQQLEPPDLPLRSYWPGR